MIPWLLPALGLGIGLWLLLLGAMPARASLAEGMARLRLLPEPPPLATRRIAQPSALIRAGTPLAGALLRRSGALGLRVLGGLVSPEDLAVVGQTEERHVAEKLASGLTGLALPLLLATVLGVAGGVLQTTIAIPLAVPLWLALVLGLGGFIAPDLVVRSNAVTRRREMVDDLTVFVQTVAMSLTANRGIEAALQDGAGAGDSWGFVQLRAALSEARIGQERPWDALGRLGSRARSGHPRGAGGPGCAGRPGRCAHRRVPADLQRDAPRPPADPGRGRGARGQRADGSGERPAARRFHPVPGGTGISHALEVTDQADNDEEGGGDMVRFRRQRAAQPGVRGRMSRRRAGERGVEMIQVAIWAVAALVIMAVLVVAVMAFVNSRTNCLNDTTISSSSNPLSGC